MKRLRVLSWVCSGLLLLAPGCGRKASMETAIVQHPLISPRIVKCTPGAPGGMLTLISSAPLQTFNPLLSPADDIWRLMFASLVTEDLTTQTMEPGLAESWTNSPDGKTWTFKLRAGIYWSDGEPLTADDVVFTWNKMVYNPSQRPAAYEVFVIDGQKFDVTKMDNLTVQVKTPAVFAPMLEFFGTMPILPEHVVSAALQAAPFSTVYSLGTPPARLVGCGPFRVRSVQGSIVLLERNPEYWAVDKKGQRLPYFNQVMVAFADRGMPGRAFLAGKGDVYEEAQPVEFAVFHQMVTNKQFRLLDLGPGLIRDVLWFNENTGTNQAGQPLVAPERLRWFRNEKFRQAVSCALDRAKMVQEAYGGRAKPVYSFVPENNRYWVNTNVPVFAYDPDRARSLLAEIGLQDRNHDGSLEDADGRPVDFAIESNTENASRRRCVEIAAEQLRQLGLGVKVEPQPFATVRGHVSTGQYECVLLGLGGSAEDPATQMGVLKSDQPAHQWFPNQKTPSTDWETKADSLMDAQMRTLDYSARKQMFDKVQSILAEQLPIICTVAPFQFAAVRTDIANLRPALNTAHPVTWNIEELYFSQSGGL